MVEAGRRLSLARDLYLECLQEDPRYAPAWARLGRIYRLLGKFGDMNSDENLQRAEAAFVRALEINPDLSMAHHLYARLDIDFGRAQDAMIRLLNRAQIRTNDPELFAGLVQACRFCDLLDASRAADEQARRLDRLVVTSVAHTYFMLGDYRRAQETSGDPITNTIMLIMLGRGQEAVGTLQKIEDAAEVVTWRRWCESLRLLVEGHRAQGLAVTQTILPPGFRDPESLYYVARQLAYLGDSAGALGLLTRAVEEGFSCFSTMTRDPWLETLRAGPAFTKILRHAEARHREALAAFLQADGDRLLGLKLSG